MFLTLKHYFLCIFLSAGSNEVVSALVQQKEQIDEITAEAGTKFSRENPHPV
jgi:hypothetical protein